MWPNVAECETARGRRTSRGGRRGGGGPPRAVLRSTSHTANVIASESPATLGARSPSKCGLVCPPEQNPLLIILRGYLTHIDIYNPLKGSKGRAEGESGELDTKEHP
eukprot:1191970-Prorocentrum_minimum.AAC.2